MDNVTTVEGAAFQSSSHHIVTPKGMIAKIKLGLGRLTPVALLTLLRFVHSKLVNNPFFATPAVPLADMLLMGDELQVVIEKAKQGGLDQKLERNALVLDAKAMLNKQADYVRLIAQGDVVKLASSGFSLAKQPESVGVPGTPDIRTVRMTGQPGEAEVIWSAQRGADSYEVKITDKDPLSHNDWQVMAITTKARHTLTGLESFKAYWVSVSAIGAGGKGVMSDPAIVRAA